VLRVHDDNGVPFSGVGVTLSAGADGVVTPAHAFTDSSGQVSVIWRLATSTGTNTLSASVVSFRPYGSDLHVLARGIRAPVGLAYYPGTDDLFVTMNQRDDLGARTPGDWLAVVKQGDSWGFPACYGQGGTVCDGVPQPVGVLDAHAAVSDVAIVTGELGSTVGTAALVAEWSDGVVKAVRLTRTSTGYAGTVTPFLAGLQHPVALLLEPSGALYVGDWGSGTIVKVTAASR
jgi:glucose/arabinose dehydrogenase